MEEIDRIRYRESIAGIANQIYNEIDPGKHQTLQKHLLEEENRYGSYAWKLDVIQQKIDESAARIGKQKRLIRKLVIAHPLPLPDGRAPRI
jgi:hypothetical protein